MSVWSSRPLGRVLVAVAAAAALAVLVTTHGSAQSPGVPPGTGVIVRAVPGNGVVLATRQGALRVGLGAVSAVGYRADCSPVAGKVVVCRDPALGNNNTATSTVTGDGYCVVHADPRLGGSNPGISAMTRALRPCITGTTPPPTTSSTAATTTTTTTAAATTTTTTAAATTTTTTTM